MFTYSPIYKMSAKYSKRIIGYDKTNIFTKFSRMALQTKSTNLGQGFPDYQPDSVVRENILKYSDPNSLQVMPYQGAKSLLDSVAKFYQPLLNYKINPEENAFITHGATQAIAAAIQALVDPGDEVIIFDPSFDIYRPIVEFAGGRCYSFQLTPKSLNSKSDMLNRTEKYKYISDKDDWYVDWKALRKQIRYNTRAIIINTPHNPLGKIFSDEDFKELADILDCYPDMVVISDEAYSHICFPPYKPFCYPRPFDYPILRDRTIFVTSIGKLFSSSGLRLGLCVGHEHLISAIKSTTKMSLKFINQPMQQAAAQILEHLSDPALQTFENKSLEYYQKSQNLLQTLIDSEFDFNFWVPQGGYFLMTDISKIEVPEEFYIDPFTNERVCKDSAFVYWLIKTKQVVAIPLQTFYASNLREKRQNYVRWAFCKSDETLNNARTRLSQKQ